MIAVVDLTGSLEAQTQICDIFYIYMCVYICVCVCVYIYIYIYIYNV